MHRLRLLGPVVAIALVASALASTTSYADQFQAEKAPVTLTGREDPASTTEFRTTAGHVDCSEVIYAGTASSFPTTTISVEPTFKSCIALGFPATVVSNGCKYLFHVNSAAGATTGTFDIVCPEGKEITATAAWGGTVKCIVDVPGQTGLPLVVYSNTGAGTTREVTIETNNISLKYSHTGGTATGLGKCSTGSSSGEYESKAVLTGEEDKATGAAHIGLFVS